MKMKVTLFDVDGLSIILAIASVGVYLRLLCLNKGFFPASRTYISEINLFISERKE